VAKKAAKRSKSSHAGRPAVKSERPNRRKSRAIRLKKRTGVSLHLGLNAVSPAHYSGWSGPLAACEFDANDMAALAKAQGMTPAVLLTRVATRAATLAAIRASAAQLKSGDFFFLSYSGHGGQVDDISGEEDDKLDETWCLFDGQLVDDELYLELGRFAKGVRILVLSDSCHSGTVVRAAPPPTASTGPQPRMMPPEIARRVYADHKRFYDQLQRDVMKAAKASAKTDPDAALAHVAVSGRLTQVATKIKAAVLLISGCQDNQTSMDGAKNGAFTEQLLKVWNKGAYRGNYVTFHAAIKAGMPPTQSPNLFPLGPAAAFARERPFSV
jgi:metacaspase-1